MHVPVLIAIDGSPRSQAILETVGQFCQPARHRLQVLLALDRAYALGEEHHAIDAFEQSEYPAASQQQSVAEQTVRDALDYLRGLGFTSEGRLRLGDPLSTIVDEARRLECGLIVMGHRHLSRLDRMFDPSISAKVVDQAGCPVLVDARQA